MKEKAAITRSSRQQAALSGSKMVVSAPLFADIPWLIHGFTTRLGGSSRFANSHLQYNQDPKHGRDNDQNHDPKHDLKHDLNLGKVPWDSERTVLKNRNRLLAHLHATEMNLVTLRQIHSDLIRVVASSIPKVGDGLITDRAGVLLSIVAADCLPILLVDVRQRVVAALHCGWRGTVRRVAQKGVGLMRMLFGSRVRDLRAAIGPGIGVCCYKVGQEVVEEFEGQFDYARKLFIRRIEDQSPVQAKYSRLFKTYKSLDEPADNSQLYLDLKLANLSQLREAGLARNHIYADAPCTSCHPELFFSHRRDAGRTGRMMGVIGIREK